MQIVDQSYEHIKLKSARSRENHQVVDFDYYEKYVMFGIGSATVQKDLVSHFAKLKIGVSEISLREPNLDEIFMSP